MFWILWIFDALMALIPIYFFFIGLKDGSVTGRNLSLWMIILLAVAGILVGSFMLMENDYLGRAKAILWVGAVPGIIAAIFFGTIMITKTRWN